MFRRVTSDDEEGIEARCSQQWDREQFCPFGQVMWYHIIKYKTYIPLILVIILLWNRLAEVKTSVEEYLLPHCYKDTIRNNLNACTESWKYYGSFISGNTLQLLKNEVDVYPLKDTQNMLLKRKKMFLGTLKTFIVFNMLVTETLRLYFFSSNPTCFIPSVCILIKMTNSRETG